MSKRTIILLAAALILTTSTAIAAPAEAPPLVEGIKFTKFSNSRYL
jgi:hypothetical protein